MVPIEYQQIAAAVALSIFRIQAMFDENILRYSLGPGFRRHLQHPYMERGGNFPERLREMFRQLPELLLRDIEVETFQRIGAVKCDIPNRITTQFIHRHFESLLRISLRIPDRKQPDRQKGNEAHPAPAQKDRQSQ